jgi:hypothetical protein
MLLANVRRPGRRGFASASKRAGNTVPSLKVAESWRRAVARSWRPLSVWPDEETGEPREDTKTLAAVIVNAKGLEAWILSLNVAETETTREPEGAATTSTTPAEETLRAAGFPERKAAETGISELSERRSAGASVAIWKRRGEVPAIALRVAFETWREAG